MTYINYRCDPEDHQDIMGGALLRVVKKMVTHVDLVTAEISVLQHLIENYATPPNLFAKCDRCGGRGCKELVVEGIGGFPHHFRSSPFPPFLPIIFRSLFWWIY